MSKYPYTITNGHGEWLTFLGLSTRDNLISLEVQNRVIPDSGPPMHVHFRQQESITVIEGIMGVQQSGEEQRILHPGETIVFQKGVMHRFWCAGKTDLICRGQIWPADNVEYFLTQIYESMKKNNDKRPALSDAAWLLNRYKTEFDMELPPFVKKVLFPISLVAGRLSGRFKKYQPAPFPVT